TLLLPAALAIVVREGATNQRLRQLSQQLREEIEERRTIERLLAEREARLQAVLRQLPAIVWTVDHDLVFISSEGSGLAQLGLRPGQVVGQTLFEYFGTEDPEYPPIRLHRLALTGEPQEYEFEWNGHVYRVRLEPLRDRSGGITGVIGIAFDITELVRTRQRLERMATTDSLTGLANRSAVIASLEQLIAARQAFAALLLDLDGFKAVNDTLGHAAGDVLLREVATRLTHTVRRDDIVGRLGGDEFLIIAPLCDRDGARELAARILVALSHPYRIDGETVLLGASIGVVLCTPDQLCEASRVLRNADLALYSAKRRGKGRIVFFHPELAEETPQEFALTQALREAIEREAITFRGLPIVHLRRGDVVGLELFPSWTDPQGKQRQGADLAGLATRAGVDIILAQRAISEALAWLRELPERWFIVLAFPSAALLDEAVTDPLAEHLATQPALRGRLWLDLPTSVLWLPGSCERLTSLADAEIGVFVRDPVLTPEGIDPLVNLQRIGIRIPSGFVRSFLSDPRAATLTRALLEVANDLSLVSLAESIDEFAVYLGLARSGCTLGQGPLFGGDLDRLSAIQAAQHVQHWRHLAAAAVDVTVAGGLFASPTATDQDGEDRSA
ncbi:MAG: diguanylate cyclase domain-containing protein, partial [Thermomicrobium sp.]